MPLVLMTGVSSFTGFWFASELAKAGFEVVATLTDCISSYTGNKADRLKSLRSQIRFVERTDFGSPSFLKEAKQADLIAHHGARVADYKSADFDVVEALKKNTHCLDKVIALEKPLVLTGSYFEFSQGESNRTPAASAYGLSKGLTTEVFRYKYYRATLPFGHFVIPNPFGPREEFRLTSSLANSWLKRECPIVRHGHLIRDNIFVSLLAKEYLSFIRERLGSSDPDLWRAPSQFVMPMRDFVCLFAKEMQSRLNVECSAEFLEEPSSEPEIRHNHHKTSYHDQNFWDKLANFYLETYPLV